LCNIDYFSNSRYSFLSEHSADNRVQDSTVSIGELKQTAVPIDLQTPQTGSRTISSIQDELFSPGSFFASRSGNLGHLGGGAVNAANRVYYH
jgi:hypothetical protein